MGSLSTLLKETTEQIDGALSEGNATAFLGFLSPDYLKFYKTEVEANAEKLSQFAVIFKKRKLLFMTETYAVFEIEHEGKTFEISMIFDDDDNEWKLKDL